MRIVRWLSVLLLASAPVQQVHAAVKIFAIGDSLTEEYTDEATLASIGTNIHNWTELIRSNRSTEANLGTYNANNYLDWRTKGASANFAFPGFTTSSWLGIINTTATTGYDGRTKTAMVSELTTSNVAVIFLGANDLSGVYSSVFNNTESPTALSDIVSRIATIHDWVRSKNATIPIVICTVADIGATPDRAATYNDPAKRITTRAKVAAFNQSIITMAQGKGATVARIDRLTDRAYDEIPFNLNGTVFTLAGASGNPAGRVFSQDNFHPATVGQFLILNEVLAACKTATGQTLTVFPNREILTVLGFDPDAPYNTWKAAYSGLGAPTADDDKDGIPNLVEYALGTSPQARTSPWTFTQPMNGTVKFPTSTINQRYASLTVMESVNLTSWTAVPGNRIAIAGDGTWTISPAVGAKGFYRLKAEVKP
ncbi:MAG: SGNH/GDSL hydrolase family protein [Luteolibacter sp.]